MSETGITDTIQYLTFRLDNETYGLDIKQVREVLEASTITKVPRMPEFMRGIINLRGGVLPVVDLRLKLGMTETEKTVDTCIIIIELIIEGENTVLGGLADSVKEVITMEEDEIVPPPKIGTRLDTEFIKGMGKKDDDFIILIDIDKVFSFEEMAVLMASEEGQEFQDIEDHEQNGTDTPEKINNNEKPILG
ncbi:MAG: chemotaxis protein CheW [Desulfobacteraceae bacterium]|jgi:purine-binding chemotaxis protein CheW